MLFFLYSLVSFLSMQTQHADKIISTKFLVLSPELSKTHVHCEIEVRPFLEMKTFDCSFLLDSLEFDIRKKCNYSKQGNLSEIWVYRANGLIISTLQQLRADKKLANYMNVDNQILAPYLLNNKIIDNRDTLQVLEIRDNEKLIITEAKKDLEYNNGLKRIYQYY